MQNELTASWGITPSPGVYQATVVTSDTILLDDQETPLHVEGASLPVEARVWVHVAHHGPVLHRPKGGYQLMWVEKGVPLYPMCSVVWTLDQLPKTTELGRTTIVTITHNGEVIFD